jgi:hypothetical protein
MTSVLVVGHSGLLAGCVANPEPAVLPPQQVAQSPSPTGNLGLLPLPLTGSSFYYYVDDTRTALTLSTDWIAVRFAGNDPSARAAALQDSIVDPQAQGRSVPNPVMTLLRVRAGVTSRQLIEGLNALRADRARLVLVNPVFQTADAEMVVTDEFVATFPTTRTKEEIDTINRSHNVEIADIVLGQANTFVLRVMSEARLDALGMANLYQESGAALHAAPNFVRITRL